MGALKSVFSNKAVAAAVKLITFDELSIASVYLPVRILGGCSIRADQADDPAKD